MQKFLHKSVDIWTCLFIVVALVVSVVVVFVAIVVIVVIAVAAVFAVLAGAVESMRH